MIPAFVGDALSLYSPQLMSYSSATDHRTLEGFSFFLPSSFLREKPLSSRRSPPVLRPFPRSLPEFSGLPFETAVDEDGPSPFLFLAGSE